MREQLPDPLTLWARASGVHAEVLDANSLAASLQLLWGHQEQLLRSLGRAFGQPQIAELAVEVMLQPLLRQARLLELAPVPNPRQAVLLGGALQAWLMAQLGLAQAAAVELQTARPAPQDNTILQAWVRAFSRRQARYLASAEGGACFARLCRGWVGLDIPQQAPPEASGPRLSPPPPPSAAAAAAQPPLLLLAPPGCAVTLDGEPSPLLAALEGSFAVSRLDWGALHGEPGQLARQRGRALVEDYLAQLPQARVLNLQPGWFVLDRPAVVELPLAPLAPRWRSVLARCDLAQLGLQRSYLPGELWAVLCDALYPDWAVEAWLEGEWALRLRRQWLARAPALSGEVLRQLCERVERPPAHARALPGFEAVSLPQLVAGHSAEPLVAALHAN